MKTGGKSKLTQFIAAGALVVLVAAIVLATTPIGCQESSTEPLATTTDGEVARVLGARAESGTEAVKIKGREFLLDLAADHPTRTLGLGGREEIPENGGMLFVFPEVRVLRFVMRNCPIPIDVAFLNSDGVVTAVHAMLPEEPQGADESDMMYESRLAKYSSRYEAQFAIELKGGMLEELRVAAGDRIDLDLVRLKRLAR